MLKRKREQFDDSIETLTSWDGFVDALNRKKMVMTPWWVQEHSISLVHFV